MSENDHGASTMTAMIPHRAGAFTRTDPQFARRLSLFAKTTGKDLVGSEIDEAVEWCEIYGANPFVKDIYFFVFDADQPERRRIQPVLSIGLYRKIAARTRCYRPDDRPARFTYDEDLRGPANPRGIVSCEVTVYQFVQNAWWPVVASVRWDERAPIVEDGAEGFKWEPIPGETWPEGHKRAGKPKMRRVPVGEIVVMLDPRKPNWRIMPETMLDKCAEAAAIRKAWPNETAGSYVDGELDKADVIDLTATEIIDKADRADRIKRIGGSETIMIDWLVKDQPIEPVPVGAFYDRALAFINKHMKPGEEEIGHIMMWRDRNRFSLKAFWAHEKDAALALKKELERIEKLTKSDGNAGK